MMLQLWHHQLQKTLPAIWNLKQTLQFLFLCHTLSLVYPPLWVKQATTLDDFPLDLALYLGFDADYFLILVTSHIWLTTLYIFTNPAQAMVMKYFSFSPQNLGKMKEAMVD